MPLTEFEKGLFVGMLEGEGSLTVHKGTEKRKGRRRSRLGFVLGQSIRIHNTCKPLLEKMHSFVGGKVYRSGKAKGTNAADKKRTKDMFVLQVLGKQAILDLLQPIISHLIEKRGRAELMIAFCESRLNRPTFKAGYTQPEIDLAENWKFIANSPLTRKGRKILKAMTKKYKSKKKGKQVFYASQKKGTITGTHK